MLADAHCSAIANQLQPPGGTIPPTSARRRGRESAMAMTEEKTAATGVVYDLQGTLLEACSCGVLCPCWIGEDPDGGTCDAFVA